MKNKTLSVFIIVLVIIGAVFAVRAMANKIPSSDKAATSYKNLMTAVQGETTAAEKYVEFAKVAAQEGNTAVERLFKATEAAEKIHLEKEYALATVMKSYDKPKPQGFKTGNSMDNIQSAIDGETYESTEMYPEFVTAAEIDNFKSAQKIFRFARDAEASHASVFKETLKILQDNGTYTDEVDYYVCPVCGKLHKGNAPLFCSVCGTPGFMFKEF